MSAEKRVLNLVWIIFLTVVLAPAEVRAQDVLRCSPSTTIPTQAVSTTGSTVTSQTFYFSFQFACRSTSSSTKSGKLTATVSFLNDLSDASGTYLIKSGAPQSIPYVFNKAPLLLGNISPSYPSCTDAAPTQTSPAPITLFTNSSVTGPGSSSLQYYYLNACIRIPTQSVSVAGSYISRLKVETSGSLNSSFTGYFESQTNNAASVLTAKINSTCTVGSLGNMAFNYTSFAANDSTLSQQLASVSCNSGSWKADIRDNGASSVTTPLNGTVRGVSYVLGLSNNPAVPTSGLNPTYPPTGTMSGQQSIYLLGRAASGQVGNVTCASPCVTSKTYTLTITFD